MYFRGIATDFTAVKLVVAPWKVICFLRLCGSWTRQMKNANLVFTVQNIACHVVLCLWLTCIHYLMQNALKHLNVRFNSNFDFGRLFPKLSFWFFFLEFWDVIGVIFLAFFCTRCCLLDFGGKFLREAILNFLSKKLPGETLCNFFQIFPPKVLVYTANIFPDTFFIN